MSSRQQILLQILQFFLPLQQLAVNFFLLFYFFKHQNWKVNSQDFFIGSESSKSLALKVLANSPVRDRVVHCRGLEGVGHPVGSDPEAANRLPEVL